MVPYFWTNEKIMSSRIGEYQVPTSWEVFTAPAIFVGAQENKFWIDDVSPWFL